MTAREAPSVNFSNVVVDTSERVTAVSSNGLGCVVSSESGIVSCPVVKI